MTVQELLSERIRTAEVADRRVEALRLAATVGRAREFHAREVQRVIDRYERIANTTGDEPPAYGKVIGEVGTAKASDGSNSGIGLGGGAGGESTNEQGVQPAV